MKKIFSLGLISIFILLFQGCISKSYMYEPKKIESVNKDIEISLIPTGLSIRAGYSAFVLKINNNSNNDLELDWNKTYFIDKGRTNGTFMYEGVVYKNRNNSKPFDIVFSNSQFSKVIYPNNYVNFYSSNGYSEWLHYGFGTGDFGVYLTLRNNGQEIREKVFITVKEK